MRRCLEIAQSKSPCSSSIIIIPAVQDHRPRLEWITDFPAPSTGPRFVPVPHRRVTVTFLKFLQLLAKQSRPWETFPPRPRIKFPLRLYEQPDFFFFPLGDLCKCREKTRKKNKKRGAFLTFSKKPWQPRPCSDVPGTYLCVRPEHSSTGRAERWVRTPSRNWPPSRGWRSRWGAVIP